MKTPEVDRAWFGLVYEPREDSFLFLDALEHEGDELRARRPSLVLEVGPGSGVVSAFVSHLLAPLPLLLLGADLNPHALRASLDTFRRNGGPARPHVMQTVRSDLAGAFGGRLDGQVDVLLFNPPYVPTGEDEMGHDDLRAAWAGGEDGMQVTDRFLAQVARLLSPNGCCYIVLEAANKPLDIARRVAEDYKLMPKQIMKRRAHNERLSVWRYTHRKMRSK